MTELEIMQRAKMYMDKLAQGIDPITDREVPEDSVLNNVRLVRCFFYVSDILKQVIDNGGEVSKKVYVRNFSITPEQLSRVRILQTPVRITQLADAINQAVDDPEMKKISVIAITNWLLAKGFLEKQLTADGKTQRIPTEAGTQIGLSTQIRHSDRGEYLAVLYDAQAQQFVLDNLFAILSEK